MNKPKIRLERIMYTPREGDSSKEPYPVYVINGPLNSGHTQGSLICTGCRRRHFYRWDQEGWIQYKCPTCGALSAWWEEYHGDEDEVEEGEEDRP